MRFYFLILLLPLALLFSGCAATNDQVPAAATPPDGNLPVTVSVTHADYNGRIIIEATYPGYDSAGDKFSVALNGSDWPFAPAGASSGSGTLGSTFAIIPGAPGRKVITVSVTHDGRTGRGQVSVDYAPQSAIMPAWIDAELCRQAPNLEVRLRFVNDFSATLNGAAIGHSFLKAVFAEGMEQVAVLDGPLAPGRNVLVMTGKDWQGQPVTLTTTLYYAPDGVVRAGDTFTVVYGEAGSRSGPFYATAIAGDALANGRDWQTPEGKLVREFHAVRPGPAVIHINKKPHFLESYGRERSIELTVR